MMDGILNIYKEAGWTSNDVVCRLRSILHQKKIGHTGTLDPDAVGVLPVCLGKATRLCELLTDHDKEYETQLRLGICTDTQDISGNILSEKEVTCSPEQVKAAVMAMIGTYDQIPPMYSAKKVNGKKLYEYAREGIEIERKASRVIIHDIEILRMELPEISLRVKCSKGTYIRTLCHDIGQYLGTGGVMTKLVRTRVGDFSLDTAITLREVEELTSSAMLDERLTNVDRVFQPLPAGIPKDMRTLQRIKNGNSVSLDRIQLREGMASGMKVRLPENCIRIYQQDGTFLAVYQKIHDQDADVYKPWRMFL